MRAHAIDVYGIRTVSAAVPVSVAHFTQVSVAPNPIEAGQSATVTVSRQAMPWTMIQKMVERFNRERTLEGKLRVLRDFGIAIVDGDRGGGGS